MNSPVFSLGYSVGHADAKLENLREREALQRENQRLLDDLEIMDQNFATSAEICEGLRGRVAVLEAALREARDIVEAAEPGLSIPPADCTNACSDGLCDCSGVRRVRAWSLDLERLRAVLAGGDAVAKEKPKRIVIAWEEMNGY